MWLAIEHNTGKVIKAFEDYHDLQRWYIRLPMKRMFEIGRRWVDRSEWEEMQHEQKDT